MSTRPTEPGNYHWKLRPDDKWRTVSVVSMRDDMPTADHFMIPGYRGTYSLNDGTFGPRIPDPDEPGAEPAGGLTAEEARAVGRLVSSHAYDMVETRFRGHPDDPTLESVLSAELARIGFTRLTASVVKHSLTTEIGLTDAEILEGIENYEHYSDNGCGDVECIAAFRRAVAEAREAKK